jgi:hypothetical protein
MRCESTAVTDPGMARLWIRLHQLPLVAAAFGALGVLGMLWGSSIIPLPAIGGFGGAVGLTWFAPVIAACVIAIPLSSPFDERVSIAGRRTRLHSAGLTLVLTLVAAALVGLLGAVEGTTHSPTQLVSGQLFWTALALISARLFGPNLAWALPLTAVVPVAVFGIGIGNGTTLLWWALPVSPGNATTVAIASGMYLGALGFWSLSPHRLRRLGWRWLPNAMRAGPDRTVGAFTMIVVQVVQPAVRRMTVTRPAPRIAAAVPATPAPGAGNSSFT